MAATKTYTGQMLMFYLLAYALGGAVRLADLERLPQAVEAALRLEPEIEALSERYRYMRHAVVVGRGLNYANAFELSLKLMETCYVVTERFSSADLMHGPIAMTSMRMGFAVYVQKPLTHDIYETRKLREMADKHKLVTQMGIQCHSRAEYKTAVKLIQGGAIGKIKEVHAWSYKTWGDPAPFPDRSDPVPPALDWYQWIGVAPDRPYIDGFYHPSEWRKRVDFGTATFGDMGCHTLHTYFEELRLQAPSLIYGYRSTRYEDMSKETPTPETEGSANMISWEYPARGEMPLISAARPSA